MSVTINGTSGITFNDNTTQATSPFAGGLGFRNRIINGDMRIDQRNNGASYTQTGAAGQYCLDRWNVSGDVTSKFSVQQNAGSVTPPTGFTHYLGATSLSAYSVPASEAYILRHHIEGSNCADLAWGTANAQTVTLSFLVRSSLTGTFGGTIKNTGNTRSYPFTFSISAANTWEYKSVTIPGDTAGTWLTNNGIGISVIFSLGAGATVSGTAGSWSGSSLFSATGATSVVGTNGATFYITGVQLEKGSTATTFDYRPYGTELQLCQRYFQIYANMYIEGYANGAQVRQTTLFTYPVEMRAAPTRTVVVAPSLTNIRGNSTTYAGFAFSTPTTKIAYQSMESTAAGFMAYNNGTESLNAEL